MPSTRWRDPDQPARRWLLLAGLAAAGGVPVRAEVAGTPPAWEAALHRLRQGGGVVMFRHALAPGTFDPPDFTLGDCRTQRNLSAAGRAQAQSIGRWFARHGLTPESVRASPWCRCLDTATLAFGAAQPWDALASPVGSSAASSPHPGLAGGAARGHDPPGLSGVGDA